nr:hypothetical protein Iba_chr02eCG6030 [Ipomoea batatas]
MVRGGGDAANLRSSGLWFAVAFGGAGVGRNRRQRKDAWTGLCGWKEPRCVVDLLVRFGWRHGVYLVEWWAGAWWLLTLGLGLGNLD